MGPREAEFLMQRDGLANYCGIKPDWNTVCFITKSCKGERSRSLKEKGRQYFNVFNTLRPKQTRYFQVHFLESKCLNSE